MGRTSGTAAGRIAADDAGEAQAAKVQAELVVVVLAEQLRVHLAHPVDRPRPLYGHVGRRVARRVRAEGADRRRHEDPQVVLLRQLDHVVHACVTGGFFFFPSFLSITRECGFFDRVIGSLGIFSSILGVIYCLRLWRG